MSMKLDGKQKQTAVTLRGALTSLAWDACESPAGTPEQLEADGSVDKLLKLLDQRFKYNKATELPEVVEEYFSSETDD